MSEDTGLDLDRIEAEMGLVVAEKVERLASANAALREQVATLEDEAVTLRRCWREDSDAQYAINVQIAAERDKAQERVATLTAGIREFAEYQDTHEPGPWIADGNSRSPDDTIQICADDECGEYWPCSSAKVIALLASHGEDNDGR